MNENKMNDNTQENLIKQINILNENLEKKSQIIEGLLNIIANSNDKTLVEKSTEVLKKCFY